MACDRAAAPVARFGNTDEARSGFAAWFDNEFHEHTRCSWRIASTFLIALLASEGTQARWETIAILGASTRTRGEKRPPSAHKAASHAGDPLSSVFFPDACTQRRKRGKARKTAARPKGSDQGRYGIIADCRPVMPPPHHGQGEEGHGKQWASPPRRLRRNNDDRPGFFEERAPQGGRA